MSDVFCFAEAHQTPTKNSSIPVAMYGTQRVPGSPKIGGPVISAVRRLGVKPSVRSFDLLSLAIAVTAADTFNERQLVSEVGWGRTLRISVPLAEPDAFVPVVPTIETALDFLTGDQWKIELRQGGRTPAEPQKRGYVTDLTKANLVCLFSGGLDSAIGMIKLASEGLHPLLVSHSYPSDKARQERILALAATGFPRFATVAHPQWTGHPFDTTMRGRSFNFLALAAVAASVVQQRRDMSRVRLVVPENGFIAINAPLSERRVGSLSTRTTHPYFLGLMQQTFDGLNIDADIENPFEEQTKGEMVINCLDTKMLGSISALTVSCGKWKRKHEQCGRCLPCLIRRIAFHRAGLLDPTPVYTHSSLPAALADPDNRSDILALSRAVSWIGTKQIARWVGASGPLPIAPSERKKYEDVVQRGLVEAREFFIANGVPV
jgi:hypothetical protein